MNRNPTFSPEAFEVQTSLVNLVMPIKLGGVKEQISSDLEQINKKTEERIGNFIDKAHIIAKHNDKKHSIIPSLVSFLGRGITMEVSSSLKKSPFRTSPAFMLTILALDGIIDGPTIRRNWIERGKPVDQRTPAI